MVNGVWVVFEDGMWGFVWVLFNVLGLVVVVESLILEENMCVMFVDIDGWLF